MDWSGDWSGSRIGWRLTIFASRKPRMCMNGDLRILGFPQWNGSRLWQCSTYQFPEISCGDFPSHVIFSSNSRTLCEFVRELCGSCAGVVRELCGSCAGVVQATSRLSLPDSNPVRCENIKTSDMNVTQLRSFIVHLPPHKHVHTPLCPNALQQPRRKPRR